MFLDIDISYLEPNKQEDFLSQKPPNFRFDKDLATYLLKNNQFDLQDFYSTRVFSLWGTKTEDNGRVEEAANSGFPEIFAHAINLYSSEAYRLINPYLRGQKEAFASHVETLQNSLKLYHQEVKGSEEKITAKYKKEASMLGTLLSDALSILPSYKGTVYRGDLLTDEELERMESRVYFDPAVMSFSKNEKESLLYITRSPSNEGEKHRVFITVESTQGKEVSDFSKARNEEEVIFRPGQKFKVESIEKQEMKCKDGKDTVRFITLSEINE